VEVLFGYLPDAFFLDDSSWSPGRTGKTWVPISSAGINKPEPLQGDIHAGNVAACRDLIKSIEEDRLPECNVLEGRTTVEMITAVCASHFAGRPVSIPLVSRRNPLLS
jgi:hypothetical protein